MRIRTIKPSFWRSDDITALPIDVRLLYVGLWSYVDDNGVGLDDYRQIAADLFALEEDQTAVREFVRDGLATLSRGLLILRYKIEDRSYLFIPKWDLHQKVDRPAKSRYPRPSDDFDPSTSRNSSRSDQDATPSRTSRETLAPGEGEKGRRGEGEEPSCAAAENVSPDRARDDEPPLPSIPEPSPGPAVTGPTAADAYRLVDAAIGREHPHTVRTALAIEVGALLVVDTDRELIFAALRLWLEKPHLGPRSLPNLVSEVIRMRNRPAPGSRPSTTDQRVAAIQALKGRFTESDTSPMLRAITGGA